MRMYFMPDGYDPMLDHLPPAQGQSALDRLTSSLRTALSRETRPVIQEAHFYREQIIRVWTQLGYCNRKAACFTDVYITPGAIYYKVDSQRRPLRQGVRIAEDLLSESTLLEIASACQRLVTGSGDWVIIQRQWYFELEKVT